MLITVAVLFGAFFGIFGEPALFAAERTGSTLIYGDIWFKKLDPAEAYNGWSTISYGIGETLFRLDDNLSVVPMLAAGYKLSDDKMIWTLTLRDGVKFHNGRAMDANAVKASLERLIAKNERAAADLAIAGISSEGNVVSITTARPNPTLLNSLCDPYACVVDASADDGGGDFNMYPVCTGPYLVKKYTPDTEAYLEPFAAYWGGTPKCESVTVKSITDVDTLALAMQNGEIDVASDLPYDSLSLFAGDDRFSVAQAPTTRVFMLYFNLRHEFMNDANFRRAVCMAIDKQSYCSVLLNGAGTPTKSAFPSQLSYGDDAKMNDVPDYDPQGARALLAASGYADSDGKKASVSIITYGRPGLPQSAQALQSALRELGVDASYKQVESVETLLKAGDFDICAYSFVTTPNGDPMAYLSFTTGSGKHSNFGHYSNPEVDALLADMATEFDARKRSEYAVRIQQIVTKDSSYSYMLHLNRFLVTKKGVRGVTRSAVDYYLITAETEKK